jgi:glycosyltransferase involved in cell wall biosynthesis
VTLETPHYSLIVACLNEEEALPHLFPEVDRLFALSRGRGLSAELVLVDDGSTDGTGALLAARAAADPATRVVTHTRNRGFGAALRSGIEASTAPIVVSYDADATYPVEDVLRLLDALEGKDVAGATPFAEGGGAEGAAPFRRLLSRGVVGLYRIAVGRRSQGITVFTCAFRAYRREALSRAPFRSDDFLAAAEILCLLLLSGATVVEVPSTLTARRHGVSKMKVMKTGLRHLGLCVKIRLRLGRFGSGATA